MDDNRERENSRHKTDHYKQYHGQWMVPQSSLKESMKIMTLMSERDKALQERNIALAERKAAIAERDTAFIQRDAAIAERDSALMVRNSALSALHFTRENGIGAHLRPGCSTASQGTKTSHHQQLQQYLHLQQQQLPDTHYNMREFEAGEALPVATSSDGTAKPRKTNRPKIGTNIQDSPSKPSETQRKIKRSGSQNPSKQATVAKSGHDWGVELVGEDLNKQAPRQKKRCSWNVDDLGLNQVTFDDSTMPAPVCSCTGKYQQCYKWGGGGWQSACCTTTLSMYPLPVLPNKRHARLGGRKMSGSVFTKLLSRLAADGCDLSIPVDLKDHWAKHGTNRYITIK